MRFAVLAHPTVQLVRFFTKIVLANLVASPEDLGEVMFAGLLISLASLIGLSGVDDAVVFAKRLDALLWARLRRLQNLGSVFMCMVAAIIALILPTIMQIIGNFFQDFTSYHIVDRYMLALAPTVWLQNLSAMPMALIVRNRQFRSVFAIDVCGVGVLSATTLIAASFGLGGWSMVLGWYACALVQLVVSYRLSRPLMPRETGNGDDWKHTMDYGTTIAGAKLLGFLGEKSDTIVVGFALGRLVLPYYEMATHIGGFLSNFTTSLGERWLFPVLATEESEDGRRQIGIEMVRFTNTFFLPVYLVITVLSQPLIDTLFTDDRWRKAAPLLALIALSFGVRCPDIIAATILKAAGHGRYVLQRSILTLAMLIVLPLLVVGKYGDVGVAAAVVVARSIGGLLTVIVALKKLKLLKGEPNPAKRTGALTLFFWVTVFLPAAWGLHIALSDHPALNLAATGLSALALWTLVRALIERQQLRREWRFVLDRLA